MGDSLSILAERQRRFAKQHSGDGGERQQADHAKAEAKQAHRAARA